MHSALAGAGHGQSDGIEKMEIRTNDDLTAALARINVLWGAEPGTTEADELNILVDLVERYESKHFPTAALYTSQD